MKFIKSLNNVFHLGKYLKFEKNLKKKLDIVKHYIEIILSNGFKEQVVISSKLASVRYQKAIEKALQEQIAEEEAKSSIDLELLKRLKFIKTAVDGI